MNYEEGVVQMSDSGSVKQQALDWLIRMDADKPLTKKEKSEFKQWLSLSEQHCQEFKSLSRFWQSQALVQLLSELEAKQARQASESHAWFGFKPAMATMALLVVGVFFLVQQLVTPGQQYSTNGLYTTVVGEQSEFELMDGSVLQLNTNTRVKVEFTQSYRNIHLIQGEAYFEVAKDPEHPFRVYAGGGRVQAVGTAFNVYLKGKTLDVLVTEGRVAVASAEADLLSLAPNLAAEEIFEDQDSLLKTVGFLDAGQSASIETQVPVEQAKATMAAKMETIDQAELERRQSWRKGLLVFTGQPITQLLSEVERFTGASFEISDASVEQILVGGRFKVNELEHAITALEEQFELKVDRMSYNRYKISAKHP